MNTELQCKQCTKCKEEKSLDCFRKRSDYDNYRSHCKDCTSIADKKYKNRNKDKNFENHIRYTYGLSVEQYNEMYDEQEGACQICSKDIGHGLDMSCKSYYKAQIDHCHISGEVRGLLCAPCNQGLGFFEDDIERMERAINYLK